MAICAHFQNPLISRILAVFRSVFRIEQLLCDSSVVFRMFLAILFFDPNSPFSKGYSLCLVAICAHFQNPLISRILSVFRSVFCIEQLLCDSSVVFRMFLAILLFDPNSPFSKGYSLCLLAFFSHFQNPLISRILSVFQIRFLQRTILI